MKNIIRDVNYNHNIFILFSFLGIIRSMIRGRRLKFSYIKIIKLMPSKFESEFDFKTILTKFVIIKINQGLYNDIKILLNNKHDFRR